MMRLIFGDCLQEMRKLADASVDLVLCDLPYGTTRNAWDTVIDLEALWTQYKRICKGAIVLTAQTPFDKVLGASNIPMLRYEWVWEKGNATGHLNAKKAPLKAHENVLVFYDRLPTYNPQKTTGHPRVTKKAGKTQSSNYGKQNALERTYDSTERYPRSVLRFSKDTQQSKLHPTQKPVSLMEYFVLTYTNPGDVVLDNCMGSGTTGVACLRTGRGFIGIEKNPEYFVLASERIERERVSQ